MSDLTEEEKSYLDEKFDQFTLEFWKRLKIPAIGLVVVIAGLVSVFASYMYVVARSDVAQAQVDFYQSMMSTQKEVNGLKTQMVENFNDFIEDVAQQKEKLAEIIEEEEVQQQKRAETKEDFVGPATSPDLLTQELEEKLREYEEMEQKSYKIDPRQMMQQQIPQVFRE